MLFLIKKLFHTRRMNFTTSCTYFATICTQNRLNRRQTHIKLFYGIKIIVAKMKQLSPKNETIIFRTTAS